MDDPTPRREPGNEIRSSRLPSQAGASISFHPPAIRQRNRKPNLTRNLNGKERIARALRELRHALEHWNARHSQHVFHLGVAQPRGVVIKLQHVAIFAHIKPPHAIGVGELRELAHLLVRQQSLQPESDLY